MKNTYIGSHIERIEDLRFLRGRGQFIADLDRAGQWHAAILRSPVAHAKIVAIDMAEALAALIRDPGRRAWLAAAGQAHVHRDFDMTRGIDRLAALFGLPAETAALAAE